MSDFNSLVQYTVENISRPVKYIIYKLTEFIRVVDKFVFRQVPAGAASGYANIEKVEGNTVAWNQMIPIPNNSVTQTLNDVVLTDNRDGSYTLNGIASANTTFQIFYRIQSIPKDHIVYIKGCPIGGSYNTYCMYDGLWSDYYEYGNGVIWKTGTYGYSVRIRIAASTNLSNIIFRPNFIDLTAMGYQYDGNNLPDLDDVKAWLAQNGLPSVADYNAGELLSVKMSGMQTEDSSQQTVDTLPFDVTTITGINTATNVRETIFPQGMKQADRAGTVKDTLDLLSDTATVKVGSRAYQSGDESDTAVITDGTTTYYALTTPIEYTDLQDANGNPLNPRYKVEQGGTEQVLPVNTSTPTTVAPTLTTVYTKDNN